MLSATNRNVSRLSAFSVFFAICLAGCGDQTIIEVDLSADKPRFTFDHSAAGWPFRQPKIDAFALASESDGLLWEIRALTPDGHPVRGFAIIYGDVPEGFHQIAPEGDARPRPLRSGRTYYVGATGPKSVYRTVFALPVEPMGKLGDPGFLPGVRSVEDHVLESPQQAKPAED